MNEIWRSPVFTKIERPNKQFQLVATSTSCTFIVGSATCYASFVFVHSLKECELGWICEEMIEFKWNQRSRLFIIGQFAKQIVDTKFRNSYSIFSDFTTNLLVNSRMNSKFKVNQRNSQWMHSQFAKQIGDIVIHSDTTSYIAY